MNDTFTYLYTIRLLKTEYLPYLEYYIYKYCIGFAFTPQYDSMLSFIIYKKKKSIQLINISTLRLTFTM